MGEDVVDLDLGLAGGARGKTRKPKDQNTGVVLSAAGGYAERCAHKDPVSGEQCVQEMDCCCPHCLLPLCRTHWMASDTCQDHLEWLLQEFGQESSDSDDNIPPQPWDSTSTPQFAKSSAQAADQSIKTATKSLRASVRMAVGSTAPPAPAPSEANGLGAASTIRVFGKSLRVAGAMHLLHLLRGQLGQSLHEWERFQPNLEGVVRFLRNAGHRRLFAHTCLRSAHAQQYRDAFQHYNYSLAHWRWGAVAAAVGPPLRS